MFEFDEARYTLATMLESNAHDAAFCVWALTASLGENFGGCVRVA